MERCPRRRSCQRPHAMRVRPPAAWLQESSSRRVTWRHESLQLLEPVLNNHDLVPRRADGRHEQKAAVSSDVILRVPARTRVVSVKEFVRLAERKTWSGR